MIGYFIYLPIVYQRTHTYILSLLRFPYNCEASHLQIEEVWNITQLESPGRRDVYSNVYYCVNIVRDVQISIFQFDSIINKLWRTLIVSMLLIIFSDKKHLSTIIASFSGKSTKKALIQPKTLFKSRFLPFSDRFWLAEI